MRFPKSFLQTVDAGPYDKELLIADVEEVAKDQEEPGDVPPHPSAGKDDGF